MEEIIPFIEQSWRDMATSEDFKVTILVVESTPIGELFKAVLGAAKIVVTAFNAEIALALVTLRTRFFIDTPFIFYLHGFASVACWPMEKWGLLDVWSEQDVFISSAQRDLDLLRLSIDTANAFVVPFALLDEIKLDETQKNTHDHLSLYYVGRISEQKNLHSLIWALSLYLEKTNNKNISLDLFGSEDNLGSPNMGHKSGPYLEILIRLTNELGLNDVVTFHGFVDRNVIADRIPQGRKVFVSPSLHADENFGMAALRALSMGHLALLSDWGGHPDYIQHFQEQVYLVDVEISKTGPFLVIPSLVDKILKLNERTKPSTLKRVPSYYLLASIKEKLKVIFQNSTTSTPVFSQNIKILARRWDEFKTNNLSSRVFDSFEDVIFHHFSMVYAGREHYFINTDNGSMVIAPWVETLVDQYIVNDPHRGRRELTGFPVEKSAEWLVENGHAFFRHDL
jgi:glycosyltransferase involved in cell wall biosynthesis